MKHYYFFSALVKFCLMLLLLFLLWFFSFVSFVLLLLPEQVETSRDMYRAVMEEVARFLERYQSQKKEQQLAAHKHCNNNNAMLEQIPRSKSLFQVYAAGGHEKSASGGNDLAEPNLKSSKATSYLRARSSTNLIDLKQQSADTKCGSKSKDDHVFEPGLLPASQAYCAFKDFTW